MIRTFFRKLGTKLHLTKSKVLKWTGAILLTYLLFIYLTQTISYSFSPMFDGKTTIGRVISYTFHYGLNWSLLWIFTFIIALFLVAGLWKKHQQLMTDERNFQYAKNALYGDARPADAEELDDIARLSSVAKAEGIILCRLDETNRHLLVHRESSRYNNNIAVFGAPSSGKSYAFVETAIIQTVKSRRSFAVTDPKGELYNNSYEYLLDNGYEIRRLDLVDLSRSDGWNCLEVLKGNLNYTIEQSQIFSKVVMENAIGDNTFYMSQLTLLNAAVLRVMLGEDYEGRRTFPEVYRLINNNSREELIRLFNVNEHPEIWPAANLFNSVADASDNAWRNIKSGLTNGLGILNAPNVARITSDGVINTKELGQKPCAYFVTLDNTHSTYQFLSSLFFSYLFIDLVHMADKRDGGKLEVGVTLILDEFATIGEIPDFPKKIASVRSRDINTIIILQDLPQLQKMYPQQLWESVLNCCSIKVGLGFNDETTSQYFSNRSGEATTVVKSEKHEAFESLFKIAHDHTTGAGKRNVYNADELQRFKQDDCLIILQGQNVLKAKKYPKTAHPEYKYWKTVNASKLIPDIMDEEAREEFYRKMSERIQNYYDRKAEGYVPTIERIEDDDDEHTGALGVAIKVFHAAKETWQERPKKAQKVSSRDQKSGRFTKTKPSFIVEDMEEVDGEGSTYRYVGNSRFDKDGYVYVDDEPEENTSQDFFSDFNDSFGPKRLESFFGDFDNPAPASEEKPAEAPEPKKEESEKAPVPKPSEPELKEEPKTPPAAVQEDKAAGEGTPSEQPPQQTPRKKNRYSNAKKAENSDSQSKQGEHSTVESEPPKAEIPETPFATDKKEKTQDTVNYEDIENDAMDLNAFMAEAFGAKKKNNRK